ncbi:glycoside hydrolase [Polychytrium aggregatum]|uniref:glycoside hydrolase n=1 Tax=Polychytrium aggregatum TaxID=110093 RepID=UPI0022FE25E9|nr:glycoside hydrolase [Polychytrium aggregatum]KAI9208065.1 glycoside hydrolase [Polychytrium aggregatum]
MKWFPAFSFRRSWQARVVLVLLLLVGTATFLMHDWDGQQLLLFRTPLPEQKEMGQRALSVLVDNSDQQELSIPWKYTDASKPRRDFIKKMAQFAWKGYYDLARGADELRPVSGEPYNWYLNHSLLSTPVDSLDTLLLMGLKEEYLQAKQLVLETFDPFIDEEVSLFETNIRIVGGLLSAYDLEGDVAFLSMAKKVADSLLPAFETPTGIPVNWVNPKTGKIRSKDDWVFLSQAGTLSLEFQYLSDITGDRKYADRALFAMEQVYAAKRPYADLHSMVVGTTKLEYKSDTYGIGASLDSFYEYLLKFWVSTGDKSYRQRYDRWVLELKRVIMKVSSNQKYVYFPSANLISGRWTHESSFHHLSCFIGGLLSLGAVTQHDASTKDDFNVGRRATNTCFQAYASTATGLGAEIVYGENLYIEDPSYYQRPETVESIFYMWRFTHDPIYREWGWNITQSIEKHLKVENGYAGLQHVQHPGGYNDMQQSFFLAETLKYLFLLFSDDSVLPLSHYVFNTEAHPLSVRGQGRRRNPQRFVPLPSDQDFPGWERGRKVGELWPPPPPPPPPSQIPTPQSNATLGED